MSDTEAKLNEAGIAGIAGSAGQPGEVFPSDIDCGLFDPPTEPEADSDAENGVAEISAEDADSGRDVAPIRRRKNGKRPVGRPRLEEAAKERVRLRVAAHRARKAATRQKTDWEQNLAALPPEERAALEARQRELSLLTGEMNLVVSGKDETDLFPDYLFLRVKQFIDQPGCGLVEFWVPDSLANSLDEDDWKSCDDPMYQTYGLRTRIVRLFWRNFLASVFEWAEKNPGDCDSEIYEAVTAELSTLVPLPRPRYVPEPVVFISEKEREARINQRELAENFKHRELENYGKFLKAQIGDAK